VLSIPALTALTNAMLSLLVRPLTVGTVIGGSLAVESLPPLAVLDAVPPVTVGIPGLVDELAVPMTLAADATVVVDPSGAIASPAGVGRASLLAAQAREANIANGMSTLMDEYLLNKLRCIS
jgi:hypothetical protein